MTEPTPDDHELRDPFLDIVLDDMRDRSEDWCVAVTPLPDGLGWRADLLLGDAQIRAGSAGHLIASKAIVLAIGRGLAAIEELIESDRADEELT